MNIPSHVLLLCWRDTDHPQGGGSETYLERLGTELAARGATVTYLTSMYEGASRTQVRDGIRFVRVGGRLSVYPLGLAVIIAGRFGRGPLAGVRPDAVVDTQNGIPFFARLVVGAPTVLLVHHCHREQWPVAGRLLGRIGWFLESKVSPWVHRRNAYVTVSQPSADELVDLGVDRERITVVHNGIDPLSTAARNDAAPASAGPRLCVLSRLVPHKQVEDALQVVAHLAPNYPDLRLDVIGDGWWAENLHAAATDLGIAERVDFHGHVDERGKHEILARADIHLMPSRKEGWGLAVIEAAQHGVPTIGYRSARGLTESIDHGHSGMLVDGVDELISTTGKLVDNPDEIRRLGDAAYDNADRYTWSGTCDGFVGVLNRLV